MVAITDKGEETRARLLLAARNAFAERGYAGTSLTDILGVADLTKGGFYFHFTSKAELAIAVVDDAQAQMAAEIQAHIVGERAIDRLVGLIRGAFAVCNGGTELHATKRICAEIADEPLVAGRIQRPHATWIGVAAGLIAEAQAEGDVPPELDAEASATMSVAAFFGLDDFFGEQPGGLLPHADAFIRFTLDGLRTDRAG